MQSNNQSNSPFYQNKTNKHHQSIQDVLITEKRISKFPKKVPFCVNAIDDMVQNSSSFEDSYNYLYRFTKEQLIKFDNTLTNNLSKNDCIVIICKKYSFKAPKDFIFNIDEDIEENIENLTNSQLDDLYSTVYDSIGEAIENDDIELHNEILIVLRTIKTEIQNRNEVTPVISTTPLITKNQRIKTLIKYAVCRCLLKKDSYEVFNKNFYKLNLKIKVNEESILKAS